MFTVIHCKSEGEFEYISAKTIHSKRDLKTHYELYIHTQICLGILKGSEKVRTLKNCICVLYNKFRSY